MGFIRGELGSRILHTKNGKPYPSGREYSFSITNQGLSYLRYQAIPREQREYKELRELVLSLTIERENAPREVKDLYESNFVRRRPRQPGVDKRFPRGSDKIVTAYVNYKENSTIRKLRQEREELLKSSLDFIKALVDVVHKYRYYNVSPLIEEQANKLSDFVSRRT